MALPGWNVSEPLHVARLIYSTVSAYRDAPSEIKSFSSQISGFCVNLVQLNECLSDSFYTPEDASATNFRDTLDRFNECAAQCKEFLKQIQANPTAAQKLKWLVTNKDTAVKLGTKIDSLNSSISVLLNLDIHKRMRQSSQDYSRAKSPGFVKPAVSPIKPSDLLSLQHPLDDQGTPTHVYSSQRLPNVSPRISAEEIGLQISISPFEVDFLFDAQISPEKKLDGSPRFPFGSPTQSSWPEQDAQDSLSKRASLVHLCTAAPEMTMTDLKGATISYQKSGSKEPPSVKCVYRIEFLKDNKGELRFISIATARESTSRLYQTISVSPPTIPHSEHPIAYKNQNLYIVKFQRPHRLLSERQSRSGSIESNMSSRTPSLINTPRTFVSTNIGQDTPDMGSPLLSPGGTRIKKESDHPRYEFKNKEDYKRFQENIVGKTLLKNIPVNFIHYKLKSRSKPQKETETQYLRLWEDHGDQTIMFNANISDRYIEYNMQNFLPPTKESTSHILTLQVNTVNVPPSPKPPGRWSWGRSDTLQDMQEEVEGNATVTGVLGELESLDSIIITFSENDGRSSFLEEARFGNRTDSFASSSTSSRTSG